MLRRLILQSSHYTIGSLLVTLAGIVSFPIFTRTFTVADYGALSLVSSLLLFWTGIGKLGVQHSIARFHAEVVAGRRGISEGAYVTTVLLGMGATGAAAVAGWLLMALAVPDSWWGNPAVPALLLPLSMLVLVRVLDSAVGNVLRAQQRSLLYASYTVARKYLSLALILLLVFHFLPGLRGFYLGTFVVEALAAAAVAFLLYRGTRFSPGDFDVPAFRAMLAFGAPMIGFELAGIMLALGDRYVIQSMMGGEALGRYSAAANLCDYARVVILVSIAQAVTPIYSRMWEENGPQATRLFVERALRLYFMIGLPLVAGMAAVGDDVLTLLATDRYSVGAPVVALLIAGMVADGSIAILGAGIYIHKQNRRIIPWVALAAAINISLNVALIPRFGLLAAAATTLAGYAFLAAAAWRLGARLMPLSFPWREVAKFALLAAIMLAVVHAMPSPGRFAGLAIRIATGVAVYAALVVAFDREARGLLAAAWMRLAAARQA
ncbi:MAG: lipopolysaccharide biosynthesis protein [Lysobacter sp.]|nr:lipopolysaccharide biosynthesis protein [Lysobacter sp.]